MAQRRLFFPGSLLLLAAVACAGCEGQVVVHGQEERGANHIIHLLNSEANVEASKHLVETRGAPRFDVVVAQEDFSAALEVLERHDLPEPQPSLQTEDGLIPTRVGERLRLVAQIEDDLQQKLRQIPGVVKAVAYVALPEADITRELDVPDPQPTASVQVLYRGDADGLPPLDEQAFRALVAAKVPEIHNENVKIELIPYSRLSARREEVHPARGESCVRAQIMGLEVCREARPTLIRALLGAVVLSGVLAAGMSIAALRALRYRRDLTRLTIEKLRV